jgi:hypothetical protein
MIDPEELPLEEMSLQANAPTPASSSWRDLWTYEKETHPAFHTIDDYRAALCFFKVGYPKLRDILKLDEWSKN